MLITAQELITRARAHTDTDEVAVKGWILDPTWLYWANRELPRFFRDILRAGLVQAEPTKTAVTGTQPWLISQVAASQPREPMAICGVTFESGSEFRQLRGSQSGGGWFPMPFPSNRTGDALTWSANWTSVAGPSGFGGVAIRTDPVPSSATGYQVYWIPRPLRLVQTGADLANGTTTSVEIPAGLDELLVLRMARSAFSRQVAAPPSLQQQLDEYESEIRRAQETLMQRSGARVRNVDHETRGWTKRGQDNPSVLDWWWATP